MKGIIIFRTLKRNFIGTIKPSDLIVTGAKDEIQLFKNYDDAYEYIDNELDGFGIAKPINDFIEYLQS